MAGTVNWYEKDVIAVIEDASDEMLTALAFQTEGYAKVDATVDTGFMRNAIYTIPAEGAVKDMGAKSGTYKSSTTGQMVERNRVATVPKMPPHTAGVHAAAEYTIYQEMRHHFLYKGLQKAIKNAGGIIKTVSRKRGLSD